MKKTIHNSVIVLNADFQPITLVNWKRALNLVLKGRAEIVESSDTTITNFDKTFEMVLPKVIKLVKFVKNVFKAKVSFTKTSVMIRDKFECGYCSSNEDLTIDHIHPVSKGGKSTWENVVTACKPCNFRKGDKLLKDTNLVLRLRPYQPNQVEFLRNKIELSDKYKVFN